MTQEEMSALIDAHLSAEDAGDLDAAVAVYTDDVEHECAATVIGSFAGIAGNGRQIRFRMLHVFEFCAGRISRENVWMDTATAMAQLQAPSTAGVGAG